MLIGLSVMACTGLVIFALEDGTYASALIAVAVQLAASPIHWLLGRAFNSRKTPQGREWHNTHMFQAWLPVPAATSPQRQVPARR
jgi:hypothetical protein